MTRHDLAKHDANRVRRDPALFALYKKYVTEDAKFLYASGKLPSSCFGCTFNKLFQRWKKHILYSDNAPTKKRKVMASGKRIFELKNKATKVYFKGKVLSNKSTGDDWHDWINHPMEKAKRDARKEYFTVVPVVEKVEKKEEKKEEKAK